MMLRITLCLLFLAMSSTVAAREVKMSSPNGSGCPDDGICGNSNEIAPISPRVTAPSSESSKIKPGIRTEAPASRTPTIRLQSFVPGMFR